MIVGQVVPIKTKKIEWMRPGISFPNPSIPHPATYVRKKPWLAMRWKVPTNKVYERRGIPYNTFRSKELNVRRGYWRRKHKYGALLRMDHGWNEITSFDEMSLGCSPYMTKPSLPEHIRNKWGVLVGTLALRT